MEVVDNPFEESVDADMIIKVKDVDIFINKNIFLKSEATNAVNKDESIIIEIINGKEWLIKTMDNYSAENVIRFFKFIIPGFIVQLNGKKIISFCTTFIITFDTMDNRDITFYYISDNWGSGYHFWLKTRQNPEAA